MNPPAPAGTPPLGRYTPFWAGTPPPGYNACWDTVNKRAVRIPLECILFNNLKLTFLSTTYFLYL